MRGVARKRSFDRTVVKKCPKCEQQAFVSDNDSSTRRVRRTERARRDSQRPDYFNSVVIDTQSKRGRRKSQSLPAHQVQGDNTATQASSDSSPVKRRRGRPRGTPNKPLLPDRTNTKTPPTPSTPPVEEDMHAELPQERIKQFQRKEEFLFLHNNMHRV
uniref:Uncharacterized protein n=1 Tax=Magallana gigas TaxID=29159 RepID=K1S1B9_MAGGI